MQLLIGQTSIQNLPRLTRKAKLDIWGIVPRAGYDRLRDGLASGGFVSPGTDFEITVACPRLRSRNGR